MSGEVRMFRSLASTCRVERASALPPKIKERVLFGGGDDAEAHFVRRALAPSDVAGRQFLQFGKLLAKRRIKRAGHSNRVASFNFDRSFENSARLIVKVVVLNVKNRFLRSSAGV
jgi:hypothetical protein